MAHSKHLKPPLEKNKIQLLMIRLIEKKETFSLLNTSGKYFFILCIIFQQLCVKWPLIGYPGSHLLYYFYEKNAV